MTVFELAAKLTLDSTSYEKGLKESSASAYDFAKKLDSGLNKVLKIGAAIGGAAVAGLTAFSKAAVQTGMQFDTAMSQVAATMGVTTAEIEQLRNFAQQMGATTAFSATQAAQALNYMALAGYDAETSMSMLPNVLNLAAAGSMDLARASDMLTDSQSALGLSLEETNELVDKMAQAASKSNTSVEQLGDAILTVGGTAKNLTGGTTELATALGILADNGVKGAEGGTALRNIILSLSAPTETASKKLEELGVSVYDAEGNMRALNDIFGDLDESMSGLTQEQRMEALATIFNNRDLKSAEALLANYGERWDELSGYIDASAGAAQKMADTQLDNLNGDITLMKSALEGAKIALSDGLSPALRDIVQRVTKALSSPKTTKFLKELGQKIGEVAKALFELGGKVLEKVIAMFSNGAGAVKAFAISFGALVVAIKAYKVASSLATNGTSMLLSAFKFLYSPLGMVTVALGVLTTVLGIAALSTDNYKDHIKSLTDEQWDNIDATLDAADAYKDLNEERGKTIAAVERESKNTQNLWAELQTLVDENGKVQEGQEQRVDYILGELNSALGTEYERNGDLIEQYQQMQDEIDKLIQKKRVEALVSAGEARYNEALENQAQLEAAIYDQQRALNEVYDLAASAGIDLNDGSVYSLVARQKFNVDEMEANLDTMLNLEQQYIHDINQQEEAYRLTAEGNYDALEELYANDTANRYQHMIDSGTISEEQLRQLKRDAEIAGSTYERYAEKLAEGEAGYTQEGLEEARSKMENLQQLYAEGVDLFAKETKSASDAAVNDMVSAWESGQADIARTMYESGQIGVAQFQRGLDSGTLQLPPIQLGSGGRSYSLQNFSANAIGLDRVPYDNYPSLLHKDEAVLTAREADEWRRGEGSGRAVENTFNFYGVSQSDLDYIVDYVNRGLA